MTPSLSPHSTNSPTSHPYHNDLLCQEQYESDYSGSSVNDKQEEEQHHAIIQRPRQCPSIRNSRWEPKEIHNDTVPMNRSSSHHRDRNYFYRISSDSDSDSDSDFEFDFNSTSDSDVDSFASFAADDSEQEQEKEKELVRKKRTMAHNTESNKYSAPYLKDSPSYTLQQQTQKQKQKNPQQKQQQQQQQQQQQLITPRMKTRGTPPTNRLSVIPRIPSPLFSTSSSHSKITSNVGRARSTKEGSSTKTVCWNTSIRVQVVHNRRQYTTQEKEATWWSPHEYSTMVEECELTSSYMDTIIQQHQEQEQEQQDTNDRRTSTSSTNTSNNAFAGTGAGAGVGAAATTTTITSSPSSPTTSISFVSLPPGYCDRGLENWTIQGEEWKEYRVQLVIDTVWQAQIDAWEIIQKNNQQNQYQQQHQHHADTDECNNNSGSTNTVLDCSEFIRQKSINCSLPSIIRAQQVAQTDEHSIQSYSSPRRSFEQSQRKQRIMTNIARRIARRNKSSSPLLTTTSTKQVLAKAIATATTTTTTTSPLALKSILLKQPSSSSNSSRKLLPPKRANSERMTSDISSLLLSPLSGDVGVGGGDNNNNIDQGPPRLPERFTSPTPRKPKIKNNDNTKSTTTTTVRKDNNDSSSNITSDSRSSKPSSGEIGGRRKGGRKIQYSISISSTVSDDISLITGDTATTNSSSSNSKKKSKNKIQFKPLKMGSSPIISAGANIINNINKKKDKITKNRRIQFKPKSKTKTPSSPVPSSCSGSMVSNLSQLSNLTNDNNNSTNNNNNTPFTTDSRMMRSHMSVVTGVVATSSSLSDGSSTRLTSSSGSARRRMVRTATALLLPESPIL